MIKTERENVPRGSGHLLKIETLDMAEGLPLKQKDYIAFSGFYLTVRRRIYDLSALAYSQEPCH